MGKVQEDLISDKIKGRRISDAPAGFFSWFLFEAHFYGIGQDRRDCHCRIFHVDGVWQIEAVVEGVDAIDATLVDPVSNEGVHLFCSTAFCFVVETFQSSASTQYVVDDADGLTFHNVCEFFTDCTVPIVPNDQKVLDLNARALKAGVRFITHDEPFWLVSGWFDNHIVSGVTIYGDPCFFI